MDEIILRTQTKQIEDLEIKVKALDGLGTTFVELNTRINFIEASHHVVSDQNGIFKEDVRETAHILHEAIV